MKSAGKARNNGLYRHIRTSKEIIRNLLNDYANNKINIGAAVYEDYQRVSHGIKNFFKSCLVKWLLSEEEGRETETLFLLSVYTASWSSVP